MRWRLSQGWGRGEDLCLKGFLSQPLSTDMRIGVNNVYYHANRKKSFGESAVKACSITDFFNMFTKRKGKALHHVHHVPVEAVGKPVDSPLVSCWLLPVQRETIVVPFCVRGNILYASYVIHWMTVGVSHHAMKKCNDTNKFLDHLSSLAILKHQKHKKNQQQHKRTKEIQPRNRLYK